MGKKLYVQFTITFNWYIFVFKYFHQVLEVNDLNDMCQTGSLFNRHLIWKFSKKKFKKLKIGNEKVNTFLQKILKKIFAFKLEKKNIFDKLYICQGSEEHSGFLANFQGFYEM